MKTTTRKAVWTDPSDPTRRGIVTEKVTDFEEGDDKKDKAIRIGERLSETLPKLSFGHKDLGWIFLKGSSVERKRTFDVETISVAHFSDNCSFEAAIAMVRQLERKVYLEYGREPAATRQDLKDTHKE